MLSLKYRLTTRNTMLAVVTVIVTLIVVSIAYTQETLKPVDALTVIDANGKKVGNVISFGDTSGNSQVPAVAFELNNLLIVLNVWTNRLVGSEISYSDSLLFESNNCTGTPYLPIATNSPIPTVAVNVPGSTLYIPDPNSVIQKKIINSAQFSPNGDCTVFTNTIVDAAQQAIPTVDLSQIFTPPFKLQTGPGQGHGMGKG